MILSLHQPAYFPWLGYFDKISRADMFVYLDTVQFEKKSFINRNQIKTPQGSIWLTIPVKSKGHRSSSLRHMEIDDSRRWREKHLKSIELNYRKTPRFDECFPKIESLLTMQESNLAEYCFFQLHFWLEELGINTVIVRSSDLQINSSKSDLVLDICRHFGAKHYLSGALGRNYLNEMNFDKAGVTIEYQDFKSPVYPQLWGAFIPNLGVLDWWLNSGDITLLRG